MRRQVFPQAPSPTMTSFRRISAILHNQERRVVNSLGWRELCGKMRISVDGGKGVVEVRGRGVEEEQLGRKVH